MKYRGGGMGWARQFNFFSDVWISAIYLSCSYGFKNVRNVIEMALKLLFLPQNHKTCPAAEGSAAPPPPPPPPPPGLSVICLSCIILFSTGSKLENFMQKNLLLVQASCFLPQSWLRFWSHSLLQIDF